MREVEFTAEDLQAAERYMRKQRARTGRDPEWEECKQYALAERGVSGPTRYAGRVKGAPEAVAGKASMPDDGSFSEHYPTTGRGSGYTTHRVGDANSTDLPPQVAPTVTKRLRLQLAQATPWIRPAITDDNHDLWSVDQEDLDRAIQYSDAQGCTLQHAIRTLGIKAQRVGHQRDYGKLPTTDIHTLTE
jgi:hypothetical protein